MSRVYVQTEQFEGPLGLLLFLIRREEMDIFNINIYQITEQYLHYLDDIKKYDLEKAGDFIAMAATLIKIKSQMLLPREEREDQEEDPRRVLVNQILEYERFKKMAEELSTQELLGRDVWGKGVEERPQVENAEEKLAVEEEGLFGLAKCYLLTKRKIKKTVHKVFFDLQSVSSRILELKKYLFLGKTMSFRGLITKQHKEEKRNQVITTFLSLLELTKLGFVGLFQNKTYEDIHVKLKKEIDENVLNQVEEYDYLDAKMEEEPAGQA